MNIKKEITDLYKKSILDTSKDLFKKQSIENTKMDDIAKQTGYSKATLYRYFKNKEEIVFTILEEKMEELLSLYQDILKKEINNKEKYDLITKSLVEFQCEYPEYFTIMTGSINTDINNPDTLNVYKEIYLCGIEINLVLGKIFVPTETDNDIIQRKVLLLWSSISGIIRMSAEKEEYINIVFENKYEFLKYSFNQIYKLINN